MNARIQLSLLVVTAVVCATYASGRVNWTTNGPTKSNGASTVTISIKEYENHAPDTVKWTLPSGAQIQPGGQSGGYRASRMTRSGANYVYKLTARGSYQKGWVTFRAERSSWMGWWMNQSVYFG